MSETPEVPDATAAENVGDYGAIVTGLIPFVGGPISALAQKYIRDRQNKRLEEFLKKLTADLEEVKDRLNKDFLTKEEAKQIFEEVLHAAEQTPQDEKLDAFESILLVTFTSAAPSYDTASEMVELVRNFQPRHIMLMRVLAHAREMDAALGHPVGDGGGVGTSINSILRKLLPDWTEDQIERTWKDLYNKQILNTSGTITRITDQGIRQIESRLNSFGMQVASYIFGD